MATLDTRRPDQATVAGRIVDDDPGCRTYSLPMEHTVLLARAATPDNMAAFMHYFALLGGVEDDIVDCKPTLH